MGHHLGWGISQRIVMVVVMDPQNYNSEARVQLWLSMESQGASLVCKHFWAFCFRRLNMLRHSQNAKLLPAVCLAPSQQEAQHTLILNGRVQKDTILADQ